MDGRRDALRRQRDAVVSAARRMGWSVEAPGGGLSAWVLLPDASSSLFADVASRHGVLLIPGSRLSPDGVLDRFMRMPFGLPLETLNRAITRLEQAWNEMQGSLGASPGMPQVV